MSDRDQSVECSEHGKTAATFVCCHLAEGVGCGYFADPDSADDPWPDACCALCQATLEREGDWTDKAIELADVRLLCAHCYEERRAANEKAPSPLRADEIEIGGERLEALLEAAREHAKQRQEEAKERFGFGGYQRFWVDRAAGEIAFSDEGSDEKLVADVIPVGTLSTRTNTWLWAWANESTPEEQATRVIPLLVFGQVRGIERLTEPHWEAEEADGWDMTSLAAHVLGGDAVYRAPAGHLFAFFVLKGFRRVRAA